ncbi:MAG: aspartyl protease family protein [Planctomycetota bacterium]|nr:aspartyl protease family protein [Planctomycetota bacterium]MDA1177301.1 aspartyl protease family protein [Planctomycetota bacterium]
MVVGGRVKPLITLCLVMLSCRDVVARTPIAGFQPLVGIGLTDEFKDENSDTFFIADTSVGPGGTWLGSGGSPHFDLALLDTGAAVSLITSAANEAFDIVGAGFDGTALQQLGGATGTIFATIEDPLGIYATGLANRTGSGTLQLNAASMKGQTSVSVLTLPAESDLPNILGLNFASQYKTSIRSDQPQLFTHDGRTVRTPNVSFGTLGSGGDGIIRRAPITLSPGSSFLSPPLYIFSFDNLQTGDPLTENPTTPTHIQGGMFLNVSVANQGLAVNNSPFFFDTGADVTVVSQLNAVQLGFDPVLDEPDFTISILGSGGTLTAVPGFFADQLTVSTVGGTLTATNVPILVLDVTDPSSPGNIVPGIVGTNVFSGRNLVIDPKPSVGGGGVGPSLYISDPVTSTHQWASSAASSAWQTPGNWASAGAPSQLWVANVNHVTGGSQEAIVSSNSSVWEVNVAGTTSSPNMTVRVANGATLTTFSGINVETGGRLHLSGGRVDAQYVEVLGGELSGSGTVEVGNGPIIGQVEIRGGTIAPGDGIGALTISGIFATSADSTMRFELGGNLPSTGYDQLIVDHTASLQGTLEVLLSPGFVPQIGDAFSLILAHQGLGGTFDSLSLPSAFQWNVDYQATRLVLSVVSGILPGDVNGDGLVDGADVSVLFGSWGVSSGAADLTRDGFVDGADVGIVFANWTGDSVGAVAVPEPIGSFLLWAILIGYVPNRIPNRRVRRLLHDC